MCFKKAVTSISTQTQRPDPACQLLALVEHRHMIRDGLEQVIHSCPHLQLVVSVASWRELQAHDTAGFACILTSPEKWRKLKPATALSLAHRFPRVCVVCLGQSGSGNLPKGWRRCVLPAHATAADLVKACQGRGTPPRSGTSAALSDRERQATSAAGDGSTIKESAGTMGVSVGSVASYRHRAMAKLGFKTESELIKYAAAMGLSDCPCGRKKQRS